MLNLTKTQQTAMQAAVDEYARAMKAATADYVAAENAYYADPITVGLNYALTLLPNDSREYIVLDDYRRELREADLTAARNKLGSRRKAAVQKLHLKVAEVVLGGGQ